MFYELIYTRCRKGIDILKKGAKIASDGYKVYSCTPEVMAEGVVDLPFFANAVQTKQSYTDPTFMDDAYLYYVPDSGKSFLVNFYPVLFDKNAKGDYSHRPGNFINHAFVGNFKEFYPFETFGNDSIWNAKTKTEAYYYEQEQDVLNPHSDISGNTPKIGFNDVGKFISDGRKDALAKAVAFLIEQYSKAPEERKYLIIRDEDSQKIELWIAAMQCAFSPKISASVSFATRMDKFVNTNRYTINQATGAFQPQINLQDPNQKQRWRAMIIGVDERDKANIGAARPVPNSPFILLDGNAKSIDYSADVSQGYFKLITSFNDEHRRFCREFMQSLNIEKPSDKIYDLFSIYNALNDLSGANTRNVAAALNGLKNLNMSGTQYFTDIYTQVYSNVLSYLQNDTSSALDVIDWLITVKPAARETLMQAVCDSFIHCLFSGKNAESYWRSITAKRFADKIVPVIADLETVKTNAQNIQSKFKPTEAVFLFTIYNECIVMTYGRVDDYVLTLCLWVCYKYKDKTAFQQLVAQQAHDLQEVLINIAIRYKEKEITFSEYIMSNFLDMPNSTIIRSDDSLKKFCQQLKSIGLNSLIESTVRQRLNGLRSLQECGQFLKLIEEREFADALSDDFLVRTVYRGIDMKIAPTDKGALQLAQTLLKQSDNDTDVCKNSANLYVLSIFQQWDKQQPNDRIKLLKWASDSKVPSTETDDYVRGFVDCIININAGDTDERLILLEFLARLPKSYMELYIAVIVKATMKRTNTKFYPLIHFIMQNQHHSSLQNAVFRNLLDAKPNEKDFAALSGLLKDSKTKTYFQNIEDAVLEELASRKANSFLGRLFGGGKSKEKDTKKNDKR